MLKEKALGCAVKAVVPLHSNHGCAGSLAEEPEDEGGKLWTYWCNGSAWLPLGFHLILIYYYCVDMSLWFWFWLSLFSWRCTELCSSVVVADGTWAFISALVSMMYMVMSLSLCKYLIR